MELKIKMALHAHKFALEPIIEAGCQFEIDDDQSLRTLQELFDYAIAMQLQKQTGKIVGGNR